MKWDAWNFLTAVKDVVVGGGRMKDGVTPRDDSGFFVDSKTNLVADSILVSGVTYIADSNSFPVLNAAASNTAVASVPYWVPRDYDEATDSFDVEIVAHMAGATDTPTLTLAGSKIAIGASSATALTTPAGSSLTTAALSTTTVKYTFNLRSNLLVRDTLVRFTLTSGAHTTDALQVLSIRVVYRSTLVSYNETDGVNAEHGTRLR